MKNYKEIPENGLIIFVGRVQEGKKENKVSFDFAPAKPINKMTYKCDNKFDLDPLFEFLEEENEEEEYGYIVVDGKEAVFTKICGNLKKQIKIIKIDLPNKHNKGGQSSNRFQNIRKEERHKYLKSVCEAATSSFIEHEKPNVKALVIAGSSLFKNCLYKSEFFDKRLKSIVIAVVDTSYGGNSGLVEAINKSKNSISNNKMKKEQQILCDFFDRINQDDQKVCYTAEDVMYALKVGAVEKIVLWEDLQLRKLKLFDPVSKTNQDVFVKEELISEESNHNFFLHKGTQFQVLENVSLIV